MDGRKRIVGAWKIKVRAEYEALGIEELENLVRHHENESRAQGFMGGIRSRSARKHYEMMEIADEVLAGRLAVVEEMIEAVFKKGGGHDND